MALLQDDVLIVLNERESRKSERAELLHATLSAKHLAVERKKPTAELAKIIQERKPKFLVLDYLLGDYGTAVDVLDVLEQAHIDCRVIIWTDEPSINAVVSVMKRGALDYLDIGDPRSPEKIVHLVKEAQDNSSIAASSVTHSTTTSAELIFEDSSSRESYLRAIAAANSSNVVVLQGPPGCGRSALATKMHLSRAFSGSCTEIQMDLWAGTHQELIGKRWSDSGCLLTEGATLILEHAEYESGELLDLIQERQTEIFKTSEDTPPLLIIGTSSQSTALMWRRILDASLIPIPGLLERKADLPALLRLFTLEINNTKKAGEILLNNSIQEAIQSLEWPGNIRQLKSVVGEAVRLYDLDFKTAKAKTSTKLSGKNEQRMFDLLIFAKGIWERQELIKYSKVDPLYASKILCEVDGDERRAAALLGTTVKTLRESLQSADRENLPRKMSEPAHE